MWVSSHHDYSKICLDGRPFPVPIELEQASQRQAAGNTRLSWRDRVSPLPSAVCGHIDLHLGSGLLVGTLEHSLEILIPVSVGKLSVLCLPEHLFILFSFLKKLVLLDSKF